jgi:hypothetical protein
MGVGRQERAKRGGPDEGGELNRAQEGEPGRNRERPGQGTLARKREENESHTEMTSRKEAAIGKGQAEG